MSNLEALTVFFLFLIRIQQKLVDSFEFGLPTLPKVNDLPVYDLRGSCTEPFLIADLVPEGSFALPGLGAPIIFISGFGMAIYLLVSSVTHLRYFVFFEFFTV
jgi:hypothetical protein